MPKIVKNTLLKYIPDNFEIEKSANPNRIFVLKKADIKGEHIVYLCERELRAKDNFALAFASSESKKLNLPLKIIHPKTTYVHKPKQNFIESQLEQTHQAFAKKGYDFEIYEGDIEKYLNSIDIAILVIDFNPILNRNWIKKLNCAVYEVDGHNIIPARFVSDKQEYSAATLRRKIYYDIYPFLSEYENTFDYKCEADFVLKDFINQKLPYYGEFKNNPNNNVLSGLSKYLNLGFISSQRVALEVVKSNLADSDKEIFLEELIIRKELADNFCFYSKNFESFANIPSWAKESLDNHKHDIRSYNYSLKELENAKTHDDLWNATQFQLLKEGVIHGYLRMYWAKKILEWTPSPQTALKYAIYLNDKYAFDAPSASGYANILWSIGGLHDRAFADFPVTGKIRRMTYNSLKKKFDIEKYIKRIYKLDSYFLNL